MSGHPRNSKVRPNFLKGVSLFFQLGKFFSLLRRKLSYFSALAPGKMFPGTTIDDGLDCASRHSSCISQGLIVDAQRMPFSNGHNLPIRQFSSRTPFSYGHSFFFVSVPGIVTLRAQKHMVRINTQSVISARAIMTNTKTGGHRPIPELPSQHMGSRVFSLVPNSSVARTSPSLPFQAATSNPLRLGPELSLGSWNSHAHSCYTTLGPKASVLTC